MIRKLILLFLIIGLFIVLYFGIIGKTLLNETIVSFLTIISSIILLLTLIEIKNQREAIYKPDLIVKSSGTFYMYSEMNFTVNLPSLWTNEEIDTSRNKHFSYEYQTSKVEFKPELQPWREKRETPEKRLFVNAMLDPDRNKIGIPLFNIGMGAAKNIEIKWEYENKDIIELLAEFYPDKQIDIRPKFDCSIGLNMEEQIDYVTPSLGSEEIIENIFIPYEFQKYFNIYVSCLFRESTKDGSIPPEMPRTFKNFSSQILKYNPKLYLNIYYHDLTNYKHYKRFVIDFKIKNYDVYPSISESRPINIVNIDNVNVNFIITEIYD